MEFIQDYIMRMIHEMVRAILKLLFNITDVKAGEEIIENQEQSEKYNELLLLVDNGCINEAENLLYEMDNYGNTNDLLVGILFYEYLNEFDDEYLEEHEFSRKEVKEGLEQLMTKYGYKSLLDIFQSIGL